MQSRCWVESWQQRRVILVRQWIHQTIGTTGIKRERGTLLIGEGVDEVISLLDLLLAETSQLIVGERLDLFLAEVIQRSRLETRNRFSRNCLDLSGLEC